LVSGIATYQSLGLALFKPLVRVPEWLQPRWKASEKEATRSQDYQELACVLMDQPRPGRKDA
jgi:hypothetical protein